MDKSYIYKPEPKREWSSYQKDIFRNIAKESGHLIVQAFAGSGKTSVLVESIKYVPRGKKVIALAFNKIIQKELEQRIPSSATALTFHSCGYRAIRQKFGNVEIDDYKVFNIIKDLLDKDSELDLITNLANTVAYCKYSLIDAPSKIDELMDQFNIDTCGFERKDFINLVIRILGLDKKDTSKIDYDDMCYMPFVYNLFLGQYDYVAVDEYQDLNRSQMIMAKKICKSNGRMIIYGDRYQDLYKWRLSDSSIIDELSKINTTKTLTLPISYRCPKSVIKLAQYWVPEITCPDSAIEGEVKEISLNEMYDLAKPGCFILSRTNAQLIKICLSFIRLGVKANIMGRDIGKQLNNLIKRSKKKQIPAFLTWLEKWKKDEIAKLKDKNIKSESITDRYECLVNVCEDSKNLEEASQKIKEMFNDTDEKNIIILSTIHRAKGRERDNVFILKWTCRLWLNKDLKYIEKPNEEANIVYTGITRSKSKLFIVNKL